MCNCITGCCKICCGSTCIRASILAAIVGAVFAAFTFLKNDEGNATIDKQSGLIGMIISFGLFVIFCCCGLCRINTHVDNDGYIICETD
jgi:hypothetical protein